MTKEEYNKNRPTITCPLCGREITNACYERHYKACSNPNSKMNLKLSGLDFTYRLDHDDLFCKFCGKEFSSKNALCQHELRCPSNADRKSYTNLSDYIVEHRRGKTKENCEEILKQSEALKQLYANGKLKHDVSNSFGQRFQYTHQEENDIEIQKWFNYIDSMRDKIVIPDYICETFSDNDSNSYLILSGSFKMSGKRISVEFEHRYLANLYLEGNLQQSNTVHHLDKNKQNNDIYNLIVFETTKEHKRFHTSPRARLKYNEITHLFNCYLE